MTDTQKLSAGVLANVLENSALKEIPRSDFRDSSYGQLRLLSHISDMYFACSFAYNFGRTHGHYYLVGAVLENNELIYFDHSVIGFVRRLL